MKRNKILKENIKKCRIGKSVSDYWEFKFKVTKQGKELHNVTSTEHFLYFWPYTGKYLFAGLWVHMSCVYEEMENIISKFCC